MWQGFRCVVVTLLSMSGKKESIIPPLGSPANQVDPLAPIKEPSGSILTRSLLVGDINIDAFPSFLSFSPAVLQRVGKSSLVSTGRREMQLAWENLYSRSN